MGRVFSFLSIIIVMAAAMYIYSVQIKNASAVGGTNSPTGVANITGVKNDLIGIANAERGYQASQGKYGSLDELISSNYITIIKQRPPYTYDIQTTSSGFQVTATRSTPGSPAQMWIDETMQVQSSDSK
jgi:hypothetical protein